MQSDQRATAALNALRPQMAQYRHAVSVALDRARKILASESGTGTAGSSLGEFASGRVDPQRFALISAVAVPLDVVSHAVLDRAIDALDGLLSGGDELFIVNVPAGASVAAMVGERLAKFGSAFGIAGLINLVRRRVYDPLAHGLPFEEHPFEKWTSGERRIAPPIIILTPGENIDPFELARYVDGSIRIVVIADGPCAPAPLARLISPGVIVAQCDGATIPSNIEGFSGPAVIGMLDEHSALFVHDPRLGASAWKRLSVSRLPAAKARKSIGRRSVAQQREDLALLESIAEQPLFPANSTDALVAAISAGSHTADPIDRLADWVLGQSATGSA